MARQIFGSVGLLWLGVRTGAFADRGWYGWLAYTVLVVICVLLVLIKPKERENGQSK